MKTDINPEKIKEILNRGVEQVFDKQHLETQLLSGKVLRIKHGVDPTGPNIHIGRAISLWKLRAFQDLGHQVVLIIGDFTAQIGDASDKETTRKCLTEQEIKENMKDYQEQFGKILDIKKTEFRYNSEWLDKLTGKDLIRLAMKFTAQQVIQRRNFKERWDSGNSIGIHELLYPLLQGYDSVAVRADVEIGGYDQLFNLNTGRDMQRFFQQEPQDIMVSKMLNGLDGRKMSTSWGNIITIVDAPDEMFGKIMSMKDEQIEDYFELCTNLPITEIDKSINPRDLKVKLAFEIVKLYHGEKSAQDAKEEFDRVFKNDGVPSIMPKWQATEKEYNIVDLLFKSGISPSKSDVRRMVLGKAVEIFYPKDMKSVATNEKFPILDLDKCEKMLVSDWKNKVHIENDMIIRVGKRKFVQIKL